MGLKSHWLSSLQTTRFGLMVLPITSGSNEPVFLKVSGLLLARFELSPQQLEPLSGSTGSMLSATIPPSAPGASVLRAPTGQTPEEPEAKVLVMRPVETVAEVQRTVESDPGSLKGLLSVLRMLTGAIELDEVFDAIEAAVFEAVPKATHLRGGDHEGARAH